MFSKKFPPAVALVAAAMLGALAGAARAEERSVSGSVTLDSLVAEAVRANPDLEAARRRYAAALEVPDQAGALEDPQFSFSYSPLPTQTRAGPMDYKFGVRQMLPFYGVRDLRAEIAARTAESVGAKAESAQFDLVREVKLVYFDWLYARQALEINRANRRLLGQFERIAEQRYRAGLVPQTDPLKAAVALAKLEALDATFSRMEEVAEGLLNVLLNRAPDAPLGEPEPAAVALGEFSFESVVKLALGRRPELRGARERLAAAEAKIALSRRDYWPNFSVGVEYAPMEKGTNPMFAKDGDDVVTASVGFNVPLQLSRRGAAVDEAAAARQAAFAELDAAMIRVRFEVYERHRKYDEARRIVVLYRDRIVPAVKLELDVTRKAYENARVDFLNLLDSERSYENIQLEQARAIRDLQQARVQLERAIGATLDEASGGAQGEYR